MVFGTWDLNFGALEILGYGFQDMVFRTWDLNFGTWLWDLNFGTWISHRGFTVAFGRGHPLVYLYNILGFVRFRWCPVVLFIHPSCHPSSSIPSSITSSVPMMVTGASLSLALNTVATSTATGASLPWCLTRRRIHLWLLFFGHPFYPSVLSSIHPSSTSRKKKMMEEK